MLAGALTDDGPATAINEGEVAESLHRLLAKCLTESSAPADAQFPEEAGERLSAGRRFLSVLAQEGWTTPTWPIEYGGRSYPPKLLNMVNSVLTEISTPDLYPFLVGLGYVGSSIIEFGSEAQKALWLPPIRTGAEIWCQLFSEPGAGSDLASLSTRAALTDHGAWRVSGQKVWSSRAAYANWGMLLTRTDPYRPKHQGVTVFAVDMASPGIEVRPIRQMNGDSHFSEVFLDDVLIPDQNRIGEVNHGWAITRKTLAREREPMFGQSTSSIPIDEFTDIVKEAVHSGSGLTDDAMKVFIQIQVAKYFQDYYAQRAQAGQVKLEIGSISKLHTSANVKNVASLVATLRGPIAMVDGGKWQYLLLTSPSRSIRGGTDQIVRNVLAERALGLPREPRSID